MSGFQTLFVAILVAAIAFFAGYLFGGADGSHLDAERESADICPGLDAAYAEGLLDSDEIEQILIAVVRRASELKSLAENTSSRTVCGKTLRALAEKEQERLREAEEERIRDEAEHEK